jgi:hypothetical protein
MKKICIFLLLIASGSFAQLKIANGAQLTVSNGDFLYANEAIVNEGSLLLNSGKLIVAHNFNNAAGTLSAANATLEFVGGATQSLTFGSSDLAKRLELNKSANIASVADGKLTITDGFKSVAGTLDAAEKIVLQSTSTKTAIVEQSIAGTVNNLVVERYIPAKRAFRLLSSPVTSTTTIKYNWQENQNNTSTLYTDNTNTASGYGTHIAGSTSGSNGFDATQTGNASLFLFDNTTQTWSGISNTDTNRLTAGGAYRLMVRGDRSIDMNTNTPLPTVTTLRSRGTLKIGSHTITGLNTTADAFNIIGNPYQSPVDIAGVLTASTNVKTTHYFVWDPKVGGINGRGAFVTYTFLNNSNNVSGSLVNQYLQPMQACFVNTLANGACSVAFQESNKHSTTNENVYRAASSTLPSLQLNLFDATSFNQDATALDGVLCFFRSDFSNGLDSFDAGKLINLDENLSLLVDNTLQSIGTYNAPINTTVYPLNLTNFRHQNYIFKAKLAHYNGLSPYLLDQFLGTTTVLEDNSTYAFSVDPNQLASCATDRFKIIFQNTALSNDDFDKNIVLFPNPANAGESFYLQGLKAETSLTVYTILGQKIPTETQIQGEYLKVTPKISVSQGIYLVTITTEDQTTSIKWIVE